MVPAGNIIPVVHICFVRGKYCEGDLHLLSGNKQLRLADGTVSADKFPVCGADVLYPKADTYYNLCDNPAAGSLCADDNRLWTVVPHNTAHGGGSVRFFDVRCGRILQNRAGNAVPADVCGGRTGVQRVP